MSQSALVIDDEPDIRELIAMSLERIGLDTHTAGSISEAKDLIKHHEFDVCLTDMRLPDGDGVEFVKYLQSSKPNLPIAVITAHGNVNSAVEAMKNGAFDFVSKPIDINLLRQLVTQAIRSGTLLEPQTELVSESQTNNSLVTPETPEKVPCADSKHYSLHSLSGRPETHEHNCSDIGAGVLIGRSEPMHELRSMIAKVAKTNAPVWITGESGTGKELIAHLIHDNSARSEKPFIAVNCGAIPPELMESELFGHRKGSFNGAHSDHTGLFKSAEGGTLFLDEVAELPLNMQVKLLRAIQERSIRRVGDTEETVTDVRILSASHKDLNAEVSAGSFRHDLYYRLNVICITSPCLRDRAIDIPIIARHILEVIQSKDPSKQQAVLSLSAENELAKYSFPGNVRELENIIERALTLSESNIIEIDDLNLPTTLSPSNENIGLKYNKKKDSYIDEVHAIKKALANTHWNRKAAAVELGLTYRQLRYRLEQYGIEDRPTGT